MKQTIVTILVAMAVSTTAFAQATRRTQKMTVQTAPAQTYVPAMYYTANHEVTALLGFASGAANFGADYAYMMGGSTWGIGGYAFIQSEKTSAAVQGITAVGGLFKVNLLDANNVKVFVAPGFGFAMIKNASPSGDETAIGPAWKMGVQYKVATNFSIGLETSTFANFFSDKVGASTLNYYSVAGSFGF